MTNVITPVIQKIAVVHVFLHGSRISEFVEINALVMTFLVMDSVTMTDF